MAHAALSDVSNGEHQAYERFARQALGLAGAQRAPLRVWLEDWQLALDESGGVWHLQLPTPGFDLTLDLAPASPVVLQGDQGLSRRARSRATPPTTIPSRVCRPVDDCA